MRDFENKDINVNKNEINNIPDCITNTQCKEWPVKRF